eukprot:1159923-Pelagomonas_calceolata.AAC.2
MRAADISACWFCRLQLLPMPSVITVFNFYQVYVPLICTQLVGLSAGGCGVKRTTPNRPKNQLKASKQQHRDLCCDLSRASAQVTLHAILFGVGGVIYTPLTLEPLKELGLDTHTATRLALKLHAHSVQYACKLASTGSALENTSLNSRHQDQAWATASNTDPH